MIGTSNVTVYSRKLRDNGLVVVDRLYDRPTKTHRPFVWVGV